MEFKYIDELELNITFELAVLQRNSQRYNSLLYQHEGTLFADTTRIGNNTNVDSQLTTFFTKSKVSNVELALVPEYSCPWLVISKIIRDVDMWPNEGKLWVVGCESINKVDVVNFKNKALTHNNVLVHYDETLLNENGNYLDPVVYLFRVNNNGQSKLLILIQFKTHHMGVWSGGEIERNNLIQGRQVYVIRNNTSSIYLMTLICSEAINFQSQLTDEKKAYLDWEDKPYLIFNPQFNPLPSHLNFRNFRNFVFQANDKEIISLNWQLNSKIGGSRLLIEQCSRSGFYVKSNEINFNDAARFTSNHKNGLYYFYSKKDRHTYLISSLPHCINIANLPVKMSNAESVQLRRDGPEVIETCELNLTKDAFVLLDNVDDYHITYLSSTGCSNSFVLDNTNCVFDKERLVNISIGKINSKEKNDWWQINKLQSLFMDESTELNQRITVLRDNSTDVISKRSLVIDALNEIQNILNDGTLFPESIIDLKAKELILSFHPTSVGDSYRFNLVEANGSKVIATIIYLGNSPDELIEKTYSNIRELFDSNNKDSERVVVFYKRGNSFLSKSFSHPAGLLNTNDYSDNSILKNE